HQLFNMFTLIKDALYYLWNGETKEEHGTREEERRRQQEQRDREIARLRAKQEAIEAKKRRERERKEESYRKFLETNEVTPSEAAPELDDQQLREQRRAAMRFAKDMQDSMQD